MKKLIKSIAIICLCLGITTVNPITADAATRAFTISVDKTFTGHDPDGYTCKVRLSGTYQRSGSTVTNIDLEASVLPGSHCSLQFSYFEPSSSGVYYEITVLHRMSDAIEHFTGNV